jgi:hypothetical protein
MRVNDIKTRSRKNAHAMNETGYREIEVLDEISDERAKPKPKPGKATALTRWCFLK